MDLKLYNTLTRKKETFVPIKKGEVGLYSCGPTVYWFAHVGNFRTYVFSDILKRVLKYNGYTVTHVMNVTDVGHLTNDSDDGDDKIEEAAKTEGKTANEIATFYFEAYLKDFEKLQLLLPDNWTWATQHIDEQIDLVKKLEEKGFTYKTEDGIYFDTSKDKDYGTLSRKKPEDLEGGKRIKLGEKKNITDFALWKFSNPNDKRQQEWDSPWGKGFPGWHVECSAMSMKYLGETFDIHTGGEDHIPIHHENEIAQSECATGKKFVNYWMHGAFLVLPDGKMSKSKRTIKTISEFEEDGIYPLSYKFFTYSAHYKKPLTWTIDGLKSAQETLHRLKKHTTELVDDKKENKDYLKRFENAINDDLNIPQAVAILWELVRDEKATGKYRTVKKMDEVFGLDLLTKAKVDIPKEIEDIAKERLTARNNQEWKKSDELRDKLLELGWKVNDTKERYTLEKI